jgi:hypothetical protein
MRRALGAAFAALLASCALRAAPDPPRPAAQSVRREAHGERCAGEAHRRNVVVIVTDGLRWQEFFRGAEAALVSDKPGGVEDVAATKKSFWRETPKERREALLPFLWSTVASGGQLWGNADAGAEARVTNRYRFSVSRLQRDHHRRVRPANRRERVRPESERVRVRVAERDAELRGRVEIVGGWDAFPRIFNRERSGLPMKTGWDEPFRTRPLRTRRS